MAGNTSRSSGHCVCSRSPLGDGTWLRRVRGLGAGDRVPQPCPCRPGLCKLAFSPLTSSLNSSSCSCSFHVPKSLAAFHLGGK